MQSPISIKSEIFDLVGAIHESPANAAQADRPGGRSLRCWLESAKKSPSITSIKSDNFVVRQGGGGTAILLYAELPPTQYYTKLAFLQLQLAKRLPSITSIKRENFAVRQCAEISTVLCVRAHLCNAVLHKINLFIIRTSVQRKAKKESRGTLCYFA